MAALADPTRRAVFERLRRDPPRSARWRRTLPVSRPAVSQHLKALKLAGLVADRSEGARRVYYIDPDGLGELRRWLDQFWDDALEAFKNEVEKPQAVSREEEIVNRTISIAPVRKTVVVQASPEKAFEVFTARIDRWWPKSHGIGTAPVSETIIEPFVGGRWYTKHEDGTEAVVGHVLIWQPGERFVVSWEISAKWKPDPRLAFASEVEVRFVRRHRRTHASRARAPQF